MQRDSICQNLGIAEEFFCLTLCYCISPKFAPSLLATTVFSVCIFKDYAAAMYVRQAM
jgi:hypothetical protein